MRAGRNVGESTEPIGLLLSAYLRRSWKGRIGFVLVTLFVLAVAGPLVVVAGMTYWPLRRLEDRLRGWQVGLAAAVLVWFLWPSQPLYWQAWAGVLRLQGINWAAVMGGGLWALAAGICFGAVYFLVNQAYREKVPVGGDIATEKRMESEGARRRRVAERRARVAYGPEPAASPALRKVSDLVAPSLRTRRGGLVVGPFLRGDLTAWSHRGRLVLPTSTTDIKHVVVLGTTGVGKSEFVWKSVEQVIRERVVSEGGQLIYINAKELAPIQASSVRMARILRQVDHDVRLGTVIRDYAGFDMLRGSTRQQQAKLLAIEKFGDDYYRHVSNLLTGLVLELRASTPSPVSSLPDLVWSMNKATLSQLAKSWPSAELLLEELRQSPRDAAGALTRYASVAMDLRGYLAGPNERGWSWEDVNVAVVDLPSGTDRYAARSLMRVMLTDLQQYLVSNRRPVDERGQHRPLTIVVEELSALDDDPLVVRQVLDLVERSRGANARLYVVAQDDLGLGPERERAAIMASGTLVSFRVPYRAAEVAALAGTYRRTESSGAYDGWITSGHEVGSTRDQYGYRVHPDQIRQLGTGECWVIHEGRAAKAYNLQPPSAYDMSTVSEDLMSALYAAQRPTELVHGMPPRGELTEKEYAERLEPHKRPTSPAETGLVELTDDDF